MSTFDSQHPETVVASLHMVVSHLHDVPDEVLESQLVTYDMFIGLAGESCREQAAQLLREASVRCGDAARRQRILRASEAVAQGVPCAVDEQGLSWQQAAQASTVTEAEWQKRTAGESSTRAAAEPAQSNAIPAGPPSIPHLSLWDMFPGLTVKIGQSFRDYDGQELQAGEILHFQARDYFAKEGGFTLTFVEKAIRLSELVPENAPIVGNEDNAWFQPLADMESLRACWDLIHMQWNWIDKSDVEHAAEIGAEIDACGRWLKKTDRGPAPVCNTAPLTPAAFPAVKGTTPCSLAFRLNFLFAGIKEVS